MIISGIVGLDLSLTSTGFSRYDAEEKSIETYTFKTDPHKDGSVIRRSLKIAKLIVRHMQPNDAVFIENYAFGIKSKISSLTQLGELGGIVKAVMLKTTGSEPIVLTTSEMRKFLSGDGKLKKDMIPVAVFKRYGRECHSHDECVALALTDMGSHLVLSEPMTNNLLKYQTDIIDRLRKSNLPVLQALAEKKFTKAKKT
jgi:crossover junction endodeoxyribonuclease RuvC